jgi:hypothetical protein
MVINIIKNIGLLYFSIGIKDYLISIGYIIFLFFLIRLVIIYESVLINKVIGGFVRDQGLPYFL